MTPSIATGPDQPLLRVHFVCTGNICRSPFAERHLAQQLPGAAVTSSGIFALEGRPMERLMVAELERRGGSAARFRARQFSTSSLEADLILAMSGRQRSHLLEEHPGAARRIGLLGHVPELANLSRALPGEALRSVIAQWTRMSLPQGRDIPDPYEQGAYAAGMSASLISDYVTQLVGVISASEIRT